MNEILWESSLNDLYQKTVETYPKTGLRQHATQPIVITELQWIPYLGVKTLFIKGIAQSEGKEYNPMILFKRVNYNTKNITETIKLFANDGNFYKLEKLSLENTDVNLRCNCPDFYWRANYAHFLNDSLYGKKRTKYESKGIYPPVNPTNAPIICKHLIKMQEVLQKSNLFKEIKVNE